MICAACIWLFITCEQTV